MPLGGTTVESARQALVQKLGENISIRRLVRITTSEHVAQYLHGGGRIGVTVAYQGADQATGKDLAMHVAASAAPGAGRPVRVSREQGPRELIEKERAHFSGQSG